MSSSMNNFMEAYKAVHNTESREELNAKRDWISEMNLGLCFRMIDWHVKKLYFTFSRRSYCQRDQGSGHGSLSDERDKTEFQESLSFQITFNKVDDRAQMLEYLKVSSRKKLQQTNQSWTLWRE